MHRDEHVILARLGHGNVADLDDVWCAVRSETAARIGGSVPPRNLHCLLKVEAAGTPYALVAAARKLS